jgi:hypothetical protein
MNTSPLNDISTTTVPALRIQYGDLLTVIQQLNSSVTEDSITVLPSNTPLLKRQALVDFYLLMNNYTDTITMIRAVNTGDLAVISNTASSLVTSITNVNSTANNLIANVTILPSKYDQAVSALTNFTTQAQSNITLAVPVVKNSILNTIDSQQLLVDDTFKCQAVASDFMKVRQGLCGDVLASFESWWSSLVIMSLYSLLSLPIIVFVANTLFLDLTQYQDQEDPEFADMDDAVVEGKGKNIQIGVPAAHILGTEQYESPTGEDPVEVVVDDQDENRFSGTGENGYYGTIPADTNVSEALIRNPSIHSHNSGIKNPMLMELEKNLKRRTMMNEKGDHSELFVDFDDHSRRPSENLVHNSLLMPASLTRQQSQHSQRKTSILISQPLPFDCPMEERSTDFLGEPETNTYHSSDMAPAYSSTDMATAYPVVVINQESDVEEAHSESSEDESVSYPVVVEPHVENGS